MLLGDMKTILLEMLDLQGVYKTIDVNQHYIYIYIYIIFTVYFHLREVEEKDNRKIL